MNKPGSEFFSPGAQQIVELRAWRVVGVGWQMALHIFETEMQARAAISDKEGGTGLSRRNLSDTLLDAELAKDRHDAWNERFAHEQIGTLVIIKDEAVDTALRQQSCQCAAGGAGSDDDDLG
jgi:hypothetical protein